MILDKRADLGHGDVKKLLFSLSVPTITSQIVNMLYNLVDRVFIGHMQPAETVGKLALTGVGVCLPIIMVISAFASLMAIGGAPLGFFYKAVNTMDSMLGYVEPPYKNIGLVPAKADDVVNYIPARLSALLMLAAGGLMGLDTAAGWRIFRRDRRKHASPNSAQTESVCAGLLGVRLAGDAWYHGVLHKKEYIGDAAREITHEDIPRVCRLMTVTAILTLLLSCGVKLPFAL